mmetsp:Transcript_814/g.1793  ORF Transcript_814/g.1793 Transcript_814/m.1793 type:complete len:92 (+) Transcript_814:500-775(+)
MGMHAHKSTDATNTGHAIWAHGEGNARCAATAAANAVLAATWYGVHELLLAPQLDALDAVSSSASVHTSCSHCRSTLDGESRQSSSRSKVS